MSGVIRLVRPLLYHQYVLVFPYAHSKKGSFIFAMTPFSFTTPFIQLWHGAMPPVTHLVSEGSPLQGDAVFGLCPSRSTLVPSPMAMSAVPPKGGTAYCDHCFKQTLDESLHIAFIMKGLPC